MGIKALRKIQIGKETDKGTAVPATAALLGGLTMKSSPTIHRPVEERGTMAEFSRSVKVADLAELTFEGDATFEQILYLLHMGILGSVSPSEVDTTGKLWTFTPAMVAVGAFDSFTIEYGDDVQAWETEYCLARAIEISGAMNEAMRMRAEIFGRQMTPVTFTPSIDPPTVESIPFQQVKLYIDDETGTIGTTEKSSSIISASYSINTGLYAKRYGDGLIIFSVYGEGIKGIELRMTFAFNAGAEVERLLFDGKTLRLIRLEIEGSVISDAIKKKLTLDFCGIYTDFATLSERDGEDVVEVVMSTQQGTNYTTLFEVAVTNAITTLP